MKTASKELEAKLDHKIQDTLKRWADGTGTSSDGFDILRWARAGYLTAQ